MSTATLYPPDPCAPPVHLHEPTPDAINLLRETIPYLQKIEYTPWTSSVLRALIADIKFVTEGRQ